MCGMAGWVDFSADLRSQSAVLKAMTQTMALRGPDAAGMWLDRHVGLGHRRLSVIDPAGGSQPMVAERNGAPAAVLVYVGEIYNYRELRRELSALGHRFRSASDTEVLLRAYLQWGDACTERLNGMFAFAIWDVAARRLVLGRDPMGVKPLYYYPTRDGLIFGSEPKAILAHPQPEAELDEDGLRELLLVFTKTPEHGIFRGMREVRPGQLVSIDHSGLRTHRYWQLASRPHTDDLATTVATVRELLEDTIARQLVADVPLCTLLSGGLDSSAVTALAARHLRGQQAGPVRTFAIDFRADPAAPADGPIEDALYAAQVAAHVNADHSVIALSVTDMAGAATRDAVVSANDRPTGLGDLYASLYLLSQRVAAQSTVALSGESADELFGGYRWFHDENTEADTFPWFAALGEGAETDRGLLDPGLFAALDLPAYRDAAYRRALSEVPHLPGENGKERRMRELSYLHLTWFVQILLDRKDRMSMANGLEVRVPFCDHRLVEYVFNAPWHMKAFDGREKSLLRAAAQDLLPEPVTARRKSPYPSIGNPGYESALRDRLTEMLSDPGSPVAPILDRRRLRAMLHEPLDGDHFSSNRRATELMLSLNRWMQRYRVRLALSS